MSDLPTVKCPRCEHSFTPAYIRGTREDVERIENDNVSDVVFARLTGRERSIAHMIALGKGNKEIASVMGYKNDQGVKNRVRDIFDKTGTEKRHELAIFIINHPILRQRLAEEFLRQHGMVNGEVQ